MDEGAGKAMFILITIIIFGIFVVIAYWLFEDQIRNMLKEMMSTSSEIVTENLADVKGKSGSGSVGGFGTP